jgi:hypothetical protein
MRYLALCGVLVSAAVSVVATRSPAPALSSSALLDGGTLFRTLRVTLRDPAPLDVEYWAAGGPRLVAASPPAREHQIELVRLRSDRLYQFLIRSTGTRGSFRTPPLPDDLAAVRFDVTGTPSVPLTLLHLFHEEGFKGYVILDADGEVVWYWRTQDFPFGIARRHNRNFVLMDKGRGIVELTPSATVVREIPQEDAEHEMHHDLITTPAGTVLYLAFDTETFNGARLKGEAIWEWWPETGQRLQRWRSWDHLSPAVDRGPRFGGEWMHANSLAIGPRGNTLVSVHYFNQIMSLSPDWQRIEWRLGGVRATLPVSREDEFSGQHTAHEVSEGRVLLFDNGRDRGRDSRALELRLDGERADAVWSWAPPRANFASAVSSARRLNNGNTLVSFGMSAGRNDASGPTEAYEVTRDGQVRWHLVVSGTTTMFRVEPIDAIGGERLHQDGGLQSRGVARD